MYPESAGQVRPWRIIHTADLQLGYKQYGFADRIEDFKNAVAYIFEQAIALKADIIDLAGDLFQTITPPGSCVDMLQAAVRSAKEAGIAVIGVEGNHDPADRSNAWLRVCGIDPLDIGVPDVKTFHAATGKCHNLRVAGLNYYRTPVLLQKLQELVNFAKEHGDFQVLVLHCSVAEMAGFRGVDLTAAQIAHMVYPVGCRLVLMGDIHDGKQLSVGGVMFTYSGSPEVTALNEQPQKVFNLIDFNGKEVRITLYPIPTRPIVNYYVGDENAADMLLAELEKYKGSTPLFVVTYKRDLPNFQARAKAMLEGRALFRLIPVENEQAGAAMDLLMQQSQQSFERKGALRNLRDIVVDNFHYDEKSDEFQLIMQAVSTPERAGALCAEYVTSKGIQITAT